MATSLYDGSSGGRVWYMPIPKQMYQGLLAGSSATLYTAPAAPTQGPPPKARIEEIILANVDTSARTVTLYVVPNGGSAGDATTIFPAFSVAANTVLRVELSTILEASGTLRGFASTANKVNITVSGTELLTVPTG